MSSLAASHRRGSRVDGSRHEHPDRVRRDQAAYRCRNQSTVWRTASVWGVGERPERGLEPGRVRDERFLERVERLVQLAHQRVEHADQPDHRAGCDADLRRPAATYTSARNSRPVSGSAASRCHTWPSASPRCRERHEGPTHVVQVVERVRLVERPEPPRPRLPRSTGFMTLSQAVVQDCHLVAAFVPATVGGPAHQPFVSPRGQFLNQSSA